ncbi:MAG: hypothetical protein AABZ84_07380 [Pseudomonadota bacterium]
MSPEILLPALLVAQGMVGGIDTLVNHEIIERLPHRVEARDEIGLHWVREFIYACLFGGLAWFEFHGATAILIAALLIGEIIVTSCDEYIENKIRVLPQNERVLHVFLTLNLGLLIAVLVPTLIGWGGLPSGLAPVEHGLLSWMLSMFALLGVGWAVRDFIAWRKLRRLSSAAMA